MEENWEELKLAVLSEFDNELDNKPFVPSDDFINEHSSFLNQMTDHIEFPTYESTNTEIPQNNENTVFSLTDDIILNADPETLIKILDDDYVLKHQLLKSNDNEKPVLYSCNYCSKLFDKINYEQHVCDYNENKCFISDEDIEELNNLDFEEYPCIQQCKENYEKLKSFLKNDLKIDVNCNNDNNNININNDNNRGNDCNNSINGTKTKKSNGPYECKMCERKFVHASGLNRHMEKHSMDLLPTITSTTTTPTTTNTTTTTSSTITGTGIKSGILTSANTSTAGSAKNNAIDIGNNLKIMFECLICGQLAFNCHNIMIHLNDEHKNILNETEDDYENDLPLDKINEYTEFMNKLISIDLSNDNDKENEIPIKTAIVNTLLQCEFCDRFYSNLTDLLLHSSKHNPIHGFECSSCYIIMRTFKEISYHWQTDCPSKRDDMKMMSNIQKYFVCNVCDNKFPTNENLLEHRYTTYHFFPRLNSFSNTLQISCEYCGSLFDDVKLIMKHHEEKHTKKSNKKDTTSTRNRQFLCDVCGKSYTQSSHLWQHLRFHKGVKPFACKEPGCDRRFTIRPDLNDHIRKCHTGERPYHCVVCGKRFLTGSVFYQHRLIHRGERRYGCKECNKRFYRADALKNHQRIHTGEKPYPCTYCSKRFRQRGDRDKHIRARHGNLEANAKAIQSMKNYGGSGIGINNHQNNNNINNNIINNINTNGNSDIVYVGNVPFPTSMFKPILTDIDAGQ